MLESPYRSIFQKDASIQSSNIITAEWNYNSFINRLHYGIYQSPTLEESFVENSGYVLNTNSLFFKKIKRVVIGSGTSGANTVSITSSDTSNISIGNILEVDGCIPVGSKITNIGSVSGGAFTITLSKNVSTSFSDKSIEIIEYISDEKTNYFPLSSIFGTNRPDPGIVNLVCNTLHNNILVTDSEASSSTSFNSELYIGNFGNVKNEDGSGRADRFYPLYKNPKFKYWTSITKRLVDGYPTTTGVSTSSNTIEYASPFVIYEEPFYANKIVVKTQKYLSYPVKFSIEYRAYGQSNWTTAISFGAVSDSTELSDGKLEIFYNGTTWSTSRSYAKHFITTAGEPSDSIKMDGIRLVIEKMSEANTPVEIIELSPRLEADISDYVMSFNKSSAISQSEFGLSVTGLSAATGDLTVSNIDRIFSDRNSNSILSGKLAEGVKFCAYQVVNSVSYPIATMYASEWAEQSDFSTNISLLDYFYFLDRTPSPEILIANVNGIPASTAILILLDNAGITNFKFSKKEGFNDDFILDWMYSNTIKTVSEVLQDIAVSAQYLIFFDAENVLNVVTKEKMAEFVSGDNTDYWLIGSEDWDGKQEEDYLTVDSVKQYVANIESISAKIIPPITESTIEYTGMNIQRQPKEILKTPELFNDVNNPFYNVSVVSRDISYVNSSLWSLNSLENDSDAALLAMTYIKNINGESDYTNSIPDILYDAITGYIPAASADSAIRYLFDNATDEERKFFSIFLDEERATEFYLSNKFSGNVLIDSEIIKFRGLIVDIFDIANPENSKINYIIFNQNERSYIESKISSGSDVICKGLLVDINLQVVDSNNAITSAENLYKYVSNGRGYNKTAIEKHLALLETPMLNYPFSAKLFNTSVSSSIRPSGSIKVESKFFKDPRHPELGNTSSYPGYLKISGPKSISGKNVKVDKSVSASKIASSSVKIVKTGQKVTAILTMTSTNTFKKGHNVFLEGFTSGASAINGNRKILKIISKTQLQVIIEEADVATTTFGVVSGQSGKVTKLSKALPIDNFGEQHITGFYKSIDFAPHRISTRMRLLAKPEKYYFTMEDDVPHFEFQNRGIGGIAFNLNTSANGTTGYFIEVEDVGNITADQLTMADYKNLRFYKVNNTNFEPQVLGTAWVNVSAVASEQADVGQALVDTHSYAGTSDLTVVIEKSTTTTNNVTQDMLHYYVYWESNLVITAHEAAGELDEQSGSKIGLFVRSDSEAMFEYIMAAAVSEDESISVSNAFSKNGKYMKLSAANDRGVIPSEVITSSGSSIKTFVEDFGKLVRECREFNVKFDMPAVSAYAIAIDKINPDYLIKDFSASSYGASFWAFNTSRYSIGLGEDKQLPIIISGVKIDKLNGGSVTLDEYARNKFGKNNEQNIFDKNKAMYGTVAVSLSGEYLNNKQQAEAMLEWIIENSMKEKKMFTIQTFANPLLQLGDKVRLYYSDMEYEIAKAGDSVYFISSIIYDLSATNVSMTLEIREV